VSRKQQASGKQGEGRVIKELRRLGFLMVEKIGTPIRQIPHPTQRGYSRVIYGEKVSGDFRAFCPGGRGVLVEAKTTTGNENLAYSQFEPHQIQGLNKAAEIGAVALVVWVRSATGEMFVMRWPFPFDFKPRTSVGPDYAAGLDVSFRDTVFVP
jgi:penicillin-binding protein-related factor A (putative recombinase)